MNLGQFTIGTLAKELLRQESAKVDLVAPTKSLTFDPTGHVLVDGHDSYKLNEQAHAGIGTRTNIPAKFYDRLHEEHPDLLAYNVNTLWHRSDDSAMLRTIDGVGRAFLSSSYALTMDNSDVAQHLLPLLADSGAEFKSCEITERRMYIKAVFPKFQGEVKKGDIVQAGISISNSEVGSGALSIRPLVYRLVCLNGMVSANQIDEGYLRKTHLGKNLSSGTAQRIFRDATVQASNRAFWMGAQDVVRFVSSGNVFQALLANMQDAAHSITIKDVNAAVLTVRKRLGLSEHEGNNVLQHLAEGGDLSQWGMVNAVTRTAQDVKSYDRASELEAQGGVILNLSPNQWKHIATAETN